ncbi:MAG TPA: alpha/beta fold hydrolase [Malonomonas sp.]
MSELPQLQTCQLAPGRKLAWREWGSGPPLIMLHGWSMSSAVFAEVAPPLGRHFRVLCPDLPGHGGSDPALATSLRAFAEMLSTWSHLLKLAPAALLGWSLGGQVALQMATERNLQLRKLLLVATTPRFCQTDGWTHALPATQIKALDRNLGRAFEKTMGDFFNLQFAGEDLPKERYRQILQFAVRTSQLPDIDFCRKVLQVLGTSDQRQQLATLDLPTQVVHGERDQIIPSGAGCFLAEQIPGATLELLPGVGHAPFFSRPDDCVARWFDFLQ